MLKTAKQKVLNIAKHSGAFTVMMRSAFRRQRLLVLAYHGVAIDDEHKWNPSLYVTEGFLRRRFELIANNGCTVLPLGEAIDRLYAGSLPERSVAITFDDGGHNFYAKALRIISEFDYPATVYLTTFYSVFNRPVFPVAADYLLWKGGGHGQLDLSKYFGEAAKFDLPSRYDHRAVQRKILGLAHHRFFSAEEKDDLLAEIADRLGLNYGEFCAGRTMSLMNETEVAAVSEAGIDVQLHTHRHRVPYVSELFFKEINDNVDVIRSITGKRPSHFCYPSGEFSRKLFPWLAEAKIKSATTCETALAGRGTRPYAIPRLVDSMHLSEVEFEGWLTGLSHFLPQRTVAKAA